MQSHAAELFFKSESSYRMLVESSSDIIYSRDKAGCFTYVSPAWTKNLGQLPSQVIGHTIGEFVHPEDQPACRKLLDGAVQVGQTGEYTFRFRQLDGTWRWHISRETPHIDGNGVMAVVGIAHDVTERHRIQSIMALTEKMVMVSGLAAGMAHEINNPLGAIMQHAQNIERRVSMDIPANVQAAEEVGVDLSLVRDYLEKRSIFSFIGHIRGAGVRASEIISQMLSFSSRGETGIATVDLSKLLDKVVVLAATDYEMKKQYGFRTLEIVREFAAEPLYADIASPEIERVLLNLMKNAAQAMAAPEMTREPRLTLRTRADEGMVVIEIEDSGPGMDETTCLRVFEPFYTTREVGNGAGLGLSVAYNVITGMHRGYIEVSSRPGEGSCFTIKLPVRGTL